MKTYLASILFATCIWAPSAVASDEGDRSSCVNLRNINGYNVIDNQHVVLNGGASRHYLVTTAGSCPDLRSGVRIATSFSANTRLCRPFIEYLIPERGFRCPIDTVEQVDSLDAARALIAEREAADDQE